MVSATGWREDLTYALREEGDGVCGHKPRHHIAIFLSTPSARRATFPVPQPDSRTRISIHALREEGDLYNHRHAHCCQISIHALREEGDGFTQELVCEELNFYPRPPRGGRRLYAGACVRGAEFLSTPSARRATASQVRPPKLLDISIHALREEGDHITSNISSQSANFYPRPPRGGRR